MQVRPYVAVASLLKQDAMCQLFFTHLQDRAPLQIVQYGRDSMASALSGASALVVIRGLFEFGSLIECARMIGVPRYYFIDDNFMLIREESDRYGASYARYTHEGVRQALSDFSGVLLAAESLIAYFAEHKLHDRLQFYPPISGPVLPAASVNRPFTVAFFGGAHRRGPFLNWTYPALQSLAQQQPVRLVAVGMPANDLPPTANLEVITPSYNSDYASALRDVAAAGVDVLVHPSDSTSNNIFKNPHVLINARAIGAAPIFSNTDPYRHVAAEGIALAANDSMDAWYAALQSLANSAALRQAINGRLSAYCDRHFNGDRNVAAITNMLAAHRAPAWPFTAARHAVAGTCLAAGRVRNRLARSGLTFAQS